LKRGSYLSFIVINPYGDIDKAIQARDWFTGFATAISYIEHFGTIKLRNYINSRILQLMESEETRKNVKKQLKEDFGKNLEKLGAKDIAFLLYAFQLIDSDTYLRLRKIIVERNKLVHPARKGIAWRYTKPERTARELLQQAKDCIQKIEQITL